ncbi:Microtubule-actin cross-linking factor 1, isoforms 1/2/3/5 620 kDa actin-binding protein [Channa argus]|uniref:Microtubule-actin cross-linking factor 1, isoforms 1/2/3/5 620 kDa actin-binding protein n=1 Tax=Channa argus TaxID=215402 RepID=A0A6G1PMZ7_CHAAH|nr:Microtubule-actin cross-linking factor 1, isoforms 1/2/3/5 620 kDa actin-binding protein [Channa argus]
MATRKDRRSDRPPLEESYGEMSSVPCPGDTLPWNLSKHQRVKRSKSATGEVLDPAERAVIRIADDEIVSHLNSQPHDINTSQSQMFGSGQKF